VSSSVCKKLAKAVEMCFLGAMLNISNFSSVREEQKQVSQVVVDTTVVETTLSANGDRPFSSSRTMESISGTSCCVLKLNPSLRADLIFWVRALKKFDGSTGVEERFNKHMFKEMDFINGDNWDDSEGH